MLRKLWAWAHRTDCSECHRLRAVFKSASRQCPRCLFESHGSGQVKGSHS